MDRRVAGVLLLVIALVCALAVPNLVGRQVAGAAVGEVIAGPPAVGTCVSALSAAGPDEIDDVKVDDAVPSRSLPVATAAPCSGQVIGEVISVSTTNTSQVSTLQEYDEAHPDCRSQVETYLGTTATTALVGVQWSKSIYVDAVTVGPDEHDRTAGRTWSACVMSAVGQEYPTPGTLKASWATGTLPAAFGLCWADQVVQHGIPTACTTPHSTQQLAYADVLRPSVSDNSMISVADPAHVLAGCRQAAASIMKVQDPTFGGRLAVKVVTDPPGAPFVQCTVSATGGKALTGSLIGLGSKPLPLS